MRYSRRKDAREVRYVVEMVGAIAVGDGRQINGATYEGGEAELDRWDREKSGGWMGARSFAVREREREERRRRHATGMTERGVEKL